VGDQDGRAAGGHDAAKPTRGGGRKAGLRLLALAALTALVTVAAAGCGGPPRTAAEFCKVYHQQERQYLKQYDQPTNNGLRALGNVIGAMSDWVPIFERLDQVAPPSIEPDVHNVLDSLKQEEQAAGQEFSDPLGGLAAGLEASMMSTASWDHLETYIEQHCTANGG
jgi:hypothetical protein